ncbi:MAG: hypothetical protein ACXVGA_09515 [Mycobacteriaceae bacterium]
MRQADIPAEASISWVSEGLALSYGTGRDGMGWRLRFDGSLWNAEQLDGTWKSRGARGTYRAAQAIAEQWAKP